MSKSLAEAIAQNRARVAAEKSRVAEIRAAALATLHPPAVTVTLRIPSDSGVWWLA